MKIVGDRNATNQNRESTEGCSTCIVQKNNGKEKDWSQQVEHMHVPNRTGPDVRRSIRPGRHATPVANVLWKPLIIQ